MDFSSLLSKDLHSKDDNNSNSCVVLWELADFHLSDFIFPPGLLVGSSSKEFACKSRRHRFDPWVGNISWKRKWHPTPVFLPEEFHGQRSLVGCSPCGSKEWDTTECLSSSSSRPCLPPSLPSGFPLSLAPSLPPSLAPALPASLPCYLPRKSQRKPWVLLMQPWAAGACCPIPRSLPVLFSTQGLLEDCFFFRHSPANIFLVVPRPPLIWGTQRSRQESSGAQPGARSKAMPLVWNWSLQPARRSSCLCATSTHPQAACMRAQSGPTLCDPMYCSPPGSSVLGQE